MGKRDRGRRSRFRRFLSLISRRRFASSVQPIDHGASPVSRFPLVINHGQPVLPQSIVTALPGSHR
jgi:hypothetical protein